MTSLEQSARMQIKAATKVKHTEVENHALNMKLKSGQISKEDYSSLLIGYSKAIRQFKKMFAEMPAPIEMVSLYNAAFDLLDQSLIMDLNNLGIRSANLNLAKSFSFTTSKEALGGTYVVLGSAYGGKVIMEKMMKSGSEEIKAATRYFKSLTQINPILFQRCSELMELSSQSNFDFQQIVSGANKTFELFSASLDSAYAELSQ